MSLTSTSGKRMLGYLPPLYETARTLQEILQSGGAELDQFWAGVGDVANQHFIQTATWAIPAWEEEFRFTPDESQTDADRRSRVLGRMRGYGTLTIKLLKQVGAAYSGGTVDVITDFASGTMVIRFVDARGLPPNLSDLQAEIRKLLPARYDVAYEFRYLTWDEFDAKNLTWDDFDALGLTWDQWEVQS